MPRVLTFLADDRPLPCFSTVKSVLTFSTTFPWLKASCCFSDHVIDSLDNLPFDDVPILFFPNEEAAGHTLTFIAHPLPKARNTESTNA